MSDMELKPCPFCGGRAEIQKLKPTLPGELCEYLARCVSVNCGGQVAGWMSPVTAIKAWNTRGGE